MLEILGLVLFCTNVGKIARGKGRKPLGYQLMTGAFWFTGEFAAIFGYMVVTAASGSPPDEGLDLGMIVLALIGGVCGGGLALVIVNALPSVVADIPPSQMPYFPMHAAGHPGSCPMCGGAMAAHHVACTHCGEWLQPTT